MGEFLVTPLRDDQISALENKLNALIVRVAELERKLSALERAPVSSKPLTQTQQTAPGSVNHNYLRRAIVSAKHEYERKYK